MSELLILTNNFSHYWFRKKAIPSTNKQFLQNTLLGTVKSNKLREKALADRKAKHEDDAHSSKAGSSKDRFSCSSETRREQNPMFHTKKMSIKRHSSTSDSFTRSKSIACSGKRDIQLSDIHKEEEQEHALADFIEKKRSRKHKWGLHLFSVIS